MDKQLSIIIINYNVYDEITACIKSIHAQFSKIDYEIIVIDNNSEDRRIEQLNIEYPHIILYLLEENKGFAYANNYALSKSNGLNILLLNPDTIIIDDFIGRLIEVMKNDNSIGACGPRLVYEDLTYQSSAGSTMNLSYDFLEAFFLIGFQRRFFKRKVLKNQNNCKYFEVSWISAACMLIKKEVIMKVNGFNLDYFLNYEDIDLCKRIRNEGYKIIYYPDFKCIHLDHKSFSHNFYSLVYNRYKSRLIYYNDHYKYIAIKSALLFHIFGLILRLIVGYFIYGGIERKSRIKGYVESLKLYLTNLFKLHSAK